MSIDPLDALNSVFVKEFLPPLLKVVVLKMLKKHYLVIDKFSILRYDLLNYIDMVFKRSVEKALNDPLSAKEPFWGSKGYFSRSPLPITSCGKRK